MAFGRTFISLEKFQSNINANLFKYKLSNKQKALMVGTTITCFATPGTNWAIPKALKEISNPIPLKYRAKAKLNEVRGRISCVR